MESVREIENICIENAIVSGSGFPATELETSIGDCFVNQWNGISLDFDNLHIDEISGNTERVIDIRYSSYQQIAGFQIEFDGVTINDVVSEYLTIIHTTNSIVGYGLTGDNNVPYGYGTLLTIRFDDLNGEDGEADMCINNDNGYTAKAGFNDCRIEICRSCPGS